MPWIVNGLIKNPAFIGVICGLIPYIKQSGLFRNKIAKPLKEQLLARS